MNRFSKLALIWQIKRSFYTWDEATLRKHQSHRINKILAFAKARSPYYSQILPRHKLFEIADAPEIAKSEFMARFNEINTVGLDRDALVEFRIQQERTGALGLWQAKYSVGLSSGTSGNKSLTVLSEDERQRYSCLLFARSGIPEHIKHHHILFALRVNNAAFMETQSFGIKIVYVDYTHSPQDLVKLINDKQLNILAGPPSLLRLIAEQRQSLKHSIDCLIAYAEVLDDETRAGLENTFAAPVVQIYQGAEGFIGSTCRKGKLHLNEDVVFVEFRDAGDSIGNAQRLVVTDLYRTTVPIIRYALNDIVELSPALCACGSRFRVIARIHGRADDIFHLRGADGAARFLFPDYVCRAINQSSNAVLEFQAIQHAIDAIEIRLIVKPDAERGHIEKTIRENLTRWAQKAGGQLGAIVFTDSLPERNPRSYKLIRVMRKF